MNTKNVELLFSPRSVAIIGASANPTKIGGRPIRYLQDFGYAGRILPVNPNHEKIGDLKCYPNLASIPGEIDHAIVAVPATGVLNALEECAARGVKVVTVFSAGFAETGRPEGIAIQARMRELARANGMRILGPNCLGVINCFNGYTGTFSTSLTRLKNLREANRSAFITQSGAFGVMINALSHAEGQGFGYFANTANEVDIQLADCVGYLVQNSLVDVVALYCEGIRDGSCFVEALKAAHKKRIPIVVSKVGVSEVGGRAASSHTGSMAGADEVYSALFKQYGVVRAADTEAMLDFTSLAGIGRLPKGRRVAIITNSGGAGVFLADKCVEFGLKVPKLSQQVRRELDKILPSYASSMNPVDCTAQLINQPELLERALSLLVQADNVDVVIVFIGLMDGYEDRFIKTVQNVFQATDKYLVLSWMAPPPGVVEKARNEGLPILTDPARTARTVSMLAECSEAWGRPTVASPTLQVDRAEKINYARQKLIEMRDCGKLKLSEYESKTILQEYGIPIPTTGLASSAEEAKRIATEIGYPVVMKVESPDILHKTDAKCVKVGIQDAAGVGAAYQEILKNAYSYNPDAKVLGINIQQMVSNSVEVLLGIKQDPIFGPCLMLGVGGALVELVRDFSLRVLPVERNQLEEMVGELKAVKLLQGFRGGPAGDIASLVDTMRLIADFAWQLKDIVAEMEINPLFVTPTGVVAGDALIVLRERG
ncbi:MAG: acetate--CoA ligase family protein [Bacillota bacterium]